MRVLIIGGSGLISTGIVKHLLARGAEVTMFNRGKREKEAPSNVHHLIGDRDEPGFIEFFSGRPFDVVIDMICFSPKQAEDDVRAFGARCEHFIFCSTVCTYGIKTPPTVLVDENFPQEPISSYGKNKLACEEIFRRADAAGEMNVTIIRPCSTYGPGGTMVDNLEFDPVAWDRIERGLPILCAGDGLGLWQSTHRDDVGKLFAYAAMNSKTFGRSYNATRDTVQTWRDVYAELAQAIGKTAKVLFLPAATIVARDPKRFALLDEITRYHGAYSSTAAKRDVPEFVCEIDLVAGARQTLQSQRDNGKWKDSQNDDVYDELITLAQRGGVEMIEV